jgi:hypothetical protein
MSNLITITTQPVGAIIIKNTADTFTVVASAASVDPSNGYTLTGIRYEWYKNNIIVPAPFGRESIFTPLPISSNSSYYVNVIAKYTNPLNSLQFNEVILKSNVVTLTIIDRPELADDQPGLELKQINEGGSASLSVALKPSPNNTVFYYQWYEGASGLESNPIQNAINSLYTTPNLTSTQTYWVKAYNLYNDYANSINSPSVRVEVLSAQQSNRQSNINKINSLTGGTNGDKLVDLDFKQISSDFVDEAVQIEAQKLLAAFPSIPNIPGTGATVYVTSVLNDFNEAQVRITSQAQSLVDCAKDIPQRLINAGIAIAKKLLLNLISNITGIAFSDLIALANALAKIIEVWDQFILSVVSAAVGAAVEAVASAVSVAENALGEVLNICNSFPYTAENGTVYGRPTNIPVGTPPSRVAGVGIPVGIAGYNSEAKGEYDLFTFQLKEYTETDPNVLALYSGTDKENYVSSISYLHTITLAYHDKIAKTVDDSQDAQYLEEFNTSITNTVAQHPSWSNEIRTDFTNRAEIISDVINRNTEVIRNFLGNVNTGGAVSTGVTIYGPPDWDFTTFLDIKPLQRPPELTQKYLDQGKYIPSGTTYTNSNGATFQVGTLNYSDAFKGAYGSRLVSDRSVASTRFPGGSIIALKNQDDSPYNPTGRNPSGQYVVDDTGSLKLTYDKLDIYTATPEPYYNSNMSNVKVYLISEGSKKGSKYQNAIAEYGKGY